MAVSWNNNLGAFQVNGRGFYATREEAQAADTTAAEAAPLTTAPTTNEFANSFNQPVTATAPKAPARDWNLNPPRTNAELQIMLKEQQGAAYVAPITADNRTAEQKSAAAFNNGNIGGAGGAYNAGTDQARAYWDSVHQDPASKNFFDTTFGRGLAAVGTGGMSELGRAAGSVGGPAVRLAVDPMGYGSELAINSANTLAGSGPSGTKAPTGPSGAPTGVSRAPVSTTADQLAQAEGRTNRAEQDWRDTEAENEATADNLWRDLGEQLDKVGPGDYGLSDEARGYQREGLQQQRMLLERMLGFDPNQYATQFADQALARTIAAGRSVPGGYAAQQAGMFAANEQAPALYAEGARMAAGLENQRLQAASGVAKSFGELGTMTRGQDETRAQFEATLPLELAKAMTTATMGQVQLNDQQSARMAEVYINFAQLQATYAGMSSAEQVAELDRMMAEKQLDQQWAMFKQELAQQGKITPKDILGGLFSLGGAAVTGGGSILAARAGRP